MLIDETGLLLAPLVKRSLAPMGETPVITEKGAWRERVSVISALSISPTRQRLGLYFQTIVKGFYNSSNVAGFLRLLLRHLRGKVTVVWDQGQMHKGQPIRELREQFDRLSIEWLPPYAPMLNAVEYIWTHLKYHELANFCPYNADELDSAIHSVLHAARGDPARLDSFMRQSQLPWKDTALAI